MQSHLFSADRALAQRIEAADAAITSSLFVKSGQFAAEPAPGGGFCLFGGEGSSLTHAMGAGMEPGAQAADLDFIEAFYRARGVGCFIDLCPLAAPAFIAAIHARPYRVIELNNVMIRSIAPGEQFPVAEEVRRAGDDELDEWSRVVARGFADGAELPPESMEALTLCANGAMCFFAGSDAGGGMGMRDGVAWMFGDATLPEARGAGRQQALIQGRLAAASANGCDLAGAAVVPGTASHRNYERAGFRLVYMRVNVVRELEGVRP